MDQITGDISTPIASPTSAGSSALAGDEERLFPGDSEMAGLMRALDWSRTPLGPSAEWPQSLRTAVSICLASRFPILIWWGPQLVMLYNDAYRQILGTKHPASLGAPGRRVWPEIWHIIGPMLEGVLQEGNATWSDDQFLPLERNGYPEECYFTFSYSPIQDESGGVGGVFCAVTETTPRVLAERRTRAARDLATTLVDAHTTEVVCERAVRALASDRADLPFTALYLLDLPGKSARLVSGSGLDATDAGHPLAPSVVPLADADKPEKASSAPGIATSVARVARTGQRETAPLARANTHGAAAPDGDALTPHAAMVLPVIEPGQATPSAVLVAGVSPQRALDDDYVGFYELLVSHLSAGLAAANAYEDERRRAEALADLDRAKTAFFGNVSHEFRTPLSLLLGPLEDLRERQNGMTPAVRDQLDVMYRNGVRLLKLVNTLLDFSRIEAGRVQANYEPTDLATYTAELASAFRSLVERAGLALDVECPPLTGLPAPVYIDREMWEKIVLNLLSNAFKYTFAGTIKVTLRPVDAGGAVELAVCDTGVGIPASELPHLFERFHRVEGARARTHEGSGIGLALVQELVQLHGGAIRVESVEGSGTTVTVRLPTGSAHLPAERVHADTALVSMALGAAPYVQEAERWLPDDAPASAEPTASALAEMIPLTPSAPANGHGARIVLADDNADMRGYLRRLLSERYQVEAVGNGAAALAAIHRQPPDLVLTDVMMPELDGFELLAALRADPRTRAVPVILLSARAGAEASAEGLRAGADDYLIKPFVAREVLSRVEARLEMARLRNEAEARARELESAFDAITDAAFVYDRDGRIVRMNGAAQTLFGLDDPAGYAAFSPEQRAQVVSPRDENGQPIPVEHSGLHRLLSGESLTGANAVDVRLRLADGRTLDVNISGAPLRSPTGEIVGAVAISRDVTERRALERASRFQASMLERAHDAIFMWELGGPVSYWNRGAELLYGYSSDEAVGQVSHDLLHTNHGVSVKEFEATIERDGEWTGELIHTTHHGRQVTVLSRQQLLREPDGRRHVLESSRDVTEQRRLEREIRASEARLRAILELLPVGVAFVDASGQAEIVNRALKAIWGEDVHVARSSAEYGEHRAWWPETGQRVRPEEWGLARALATGQVSPAQEIDIEAHDGERKTILDSDAPLLDESGNVIGGMSVLVDITERKRLERRTHDILEALLAMAEALMLDSGGADPKQDEAQREARTDGDAALFVSHPGVRRVMELTQRVFRGQYTAVTVTEPERKALRPIAVVGLSAEIEQRWWQSVTQGQLTDYFPPALVERLHAGEVMVLDMSEQPPVPGQDYFGIQAILVAPALTRAGHLCLLGAEVRGRTAFSPEEIDLARAAVRLVALILEREQLDRDRAEARTHELAAVEAKQRMDEFVGIASHEMRTPLTSITANVQLAERDLKALAAATDDDATDSKAHSKLERAHMIMERTSRQVARLDRLVGDLLDVSRIESGKLELRLEPHDLLAIVREAVQEQRAAWPLRTVALDLPHRASLPIHADGDRIGQVVSNYLTNALKYSAESQPVTIRVRMRGDSVRVEVRDSGPGLSAGQQARLFERFYRVPGIEQQSGSGVGLGLGLYICKTIIERHGGVLGVESALGKGSAFWFTLPLAGSDTTAATIK